MNYETYLHQAKELERELELKKIELMKEFVISNNPYKIGYIITDHIGMILIEKMGFAWGYNGAPPCATYTGVELKKDGTPNKRGNRRQVWQSNVAAV